MRLHKQLDLYVQSALDGASGVTVAVLGDYCMDLYLHVDSAKSEISVETGLPTRPIGQYNVYAGGAGNVAVNLASLGAGNVHAVGIVGADMYGGELTRLLNREGVTTDSLFVQEKDFTTHVYTKVYQDGAEDPRLDMGNFNTVSAEMEQKLLDAVKSEVQRCDVFVINQQVLSGLYSPTFVESLVQILQHRHTATVLVDSRSLADRFPDTVRKINEEEARRYFAATTAAPTGSTAVDTPLDQVVTGLSRVWKTPLVVSRGQDGAIVCVNDTLTTIPGIQVPRPIDTVGAGDTLLAGTALGLAAGLDLPAAVHIGNLAASVTVRKLKRTGTASPQELRAAAKNTAYRLNPELADLPGRATWLAGTQIEVIEPISDKRPFRFAVFDHDGTVSVLRQGWEPVMTEMMVESIFGDRLHSASSSEIEEVTETATTFISDTTGIQSIEQMSGLVRLVREFGYVRADKIADAGTYKKRYLDRLEETIRERRELVKSGVLTVEEVTVKGAVATLHLLRKRGFSLFLASGTDHDAVVEEATALGYADLFNGGIFGSVDDADNDPKRVVLSRIMETVGADGARQLLTFGDGPVEIRETLRAGGVPVGVASDEIRRYGLNTDKRRRLILAGAHYVIPDFRDIGALLAELTGEKGGEKL